MSMVPLLMAVNKSLVGITDSGGTTLIFRRPLVAFSMTSANSKV